MKRYSLLLASNLVLAVVYFASGRFGLSLAFANPSASPVWPPTGLALAGVMLVGYRVWPGIFAGAFLVNLSTAGTVPLPSASRWATRWKRSPADGC